jgi:enamine deaminase RidA (YjgF/YER057c/UK114 family)
MSIADTLSTFGITLPTPAAPAGAYIPVVTYNKCVYISGQLPIEDGKLKYTGKVGNEQSIENGQQSAKLCVINALAALNAELGSLDSVTRIIKLEVYVNSATGFTDQAQVANGASNFLKEVFGDKGLHTRVALGAAELPLNAATEIVITAAFE